MLVVNHENHEIRSQSFTSSCARSTFGFVCSVREFCLQREILLFAACWSFVCSVREFCLQRIILSFAARWNFVCSVREFCFKRVILFLVVCMYFFTVSFLFAVCRRWFVWPIIYVCKEFFICRVFSLLKRCPLWATVTISTSGTLNLHYISVRDISTYAR